MAALLLRGRVWIWSIAGGPLEGRAAPGKPGRRRGAPFHWVACRWNVLLGVRIRFESKLTRSFTFKVGSLFRTALCGRRIVSGPHFSACVAGKIYREPTVRD